MNSHSLVILRRPTDCQEEAIPLILGGGDVLLVGFQSLNDVLGGSYGIWQNCCITKKSSVNSRLSDFLSYRSSGKCFS